MRTEYPVKILIAWAEAITGNAAIRDWLIKNGYPELGIFVFALHLKADARKWLMDHGHPHLMALVSGVEGDEVALKWLDAHDMHVLRQVAVAGGDKEAFQWLVAQGHRELAMIALRMWSVKMAIEDDHQDIHKYARD